MKRSIQAELLQWKDSPNRKPLILQGARQVGKTFALKQFGETAFSSVAYLNMEREERARDIFRSDLTPDRLLRDIALYVGKAVTSGATLLIIDEIQACPPALTALKYFAEEIPALHVATAGSLLGVAMNQGVSFPVGKVNFLSLYPLGFSEFLIALDQLMLADVLTTATVNEQLPDGIHERLIEYLRLYYFTGGMPEVVAQWCKTNDPELVRSIQGDILRSYENDFAKHGSDTHALRIRDLWRSVPRQLAHENNRFMLARVEKGAKWREYSLALQWLRDAGLVHVSTRLKTAKIPPEHYTDGEYIKLYLLDVGLLTAQWQLSSTTIREGSVLFQEAKGPLAENFVAQELVCAGASPLYHWTSSATAEVDFIVLTGDRALPLEVKAGTSLNHKSLRSFATTHPDTPLSRATLRNFRTEGGIGNIPIYAAGFFPQNRV